MEDKKTAMILKGIAEKYPLNTEEKAAIKSAIGVMAWVSLAQSRIKAKKAKREKSMEWK